MLGVLLFGEEITTSMAIGGGLIVLAAALARLQQPAVAGCDRRKAH
jgi:drug/metabolite transporter (DMT)-like permease